MANFLDVINEWIDNTEYVIDEVLQTVVIKIGTAVINISPVDTGLFKGNWQLSIDETSSQSLLRYDPDGYATLNALAAKANSFTAGQIAYIQNHVSYGADLERGTSKQAPDGVVEINTTMTQFLRVVNEATQLHKRD